MRTILKVLRDADPRAPLCRHIGISAQYASNIINMDKTIGATKTVAEVSARLGLTDAEIGASVREMFPEPFERQRTAEPASDAA